MSDIAQKTYSTFDEMPGYTPKAQLEEQLDALQKAFELSKTDGVKGSTRAIFNQAFALAKKNGLETFWGGKYGTRLKGEIKREGSVTAIDKKTYDKVTGQSFPMPKKFNPEEYQSMQYTIAQPLNAQPIPEDVREREAIGSAYSGVTNALGAATLVGSIGGGLGLTANRALPTAIEEFGGNLLQGGWSWEKSLRNAINAGEGMPIQHMMPFR